MPKGVPNRKYTPEFKRLVVETMLKEKLGYIETAERFEIRHKRVQDWERIPKKLASLGFGRRATPAQKTQVVQELRQRHTLDILLSIAQLPRATFYYHLKRMSRVDKHKAAKEEITAIYHENRDSYGYRRITAELRNRDILLSRDL